MSKSIEDVKISLHVLLKTRLQLIEKEDVINDVGSAPLSILSTNPDAVISLAHQKLHAFPFKDVPVCWRRLYEESTLWKVLRLCEKIGARSEELNQDWEAEVIALLDMAMILTGAPGRAGVISLAFDLLDRATDSRLDKPEGQDDLPRPSKRQRLAEREMTTYSVLSAFPKESQGAAPQLKHPVLRLRDPSLEGFTEHMYAAATPAILTDTLTHWPALERWQKPHYWLHRTHEGRRLVPVEMGRSYTDEGWGQRICPFREFLEGSMLSRKSFEYDQRHYDKEVPGRPEEILEPTMQTAYLAQHDLLTQIPALRADIVIPDYCYISPPPFVSHEGQDSIPTRQRPSSPCPSISSVCSSTVSLPASTSLNIWLGPGGTISPAHTDPHHNLLAQVFGRKYVRLYAPTQGHHLYPMTSSPCSPDVSPDLPGDDSHTLHGVDMHNTSQVDVGLEASFPGMAAEDKERHVAAAMAQRARFPSFTNAKCLEAVLGPGEMLYIPRGWWHYVRSLEASCSVSFWWD